MQDKSGFSHRIKKPACRLLLGCRCVHPKGTSYGRPHWAIRGVAALRSALHSDRTFITRGLYLITRRGFDSDAL